MWSVPSVLTELPGSAWQGLHLSLLLMASLPCRACPPHRASEARRWAAAVEQQEGQLSELRVQLEAERRQRSEAQQALAAARGEGEAAKEDAAALLGQLRAAEAMASAVEGGSAVAVVRVGLALRSISNSRLSASCPACKLAPAATRASLPPSTHGVPTPLSCCSWHTGEAACVRGQLAVAEEALGRARSKVDRLKQEAAATAAR